MAREHARVKLSIWEDDEFRALSPAAQHLYFVLLTSMKLDYCGVTDWRPGRIAKLAGGWSTEAVEIAAQELADQLYLIIDTGSEEVLIRSFIRNDELLDSPNMAVAVRKAHGAIASGALRAIVVHELNRLRKDKPDLKGWPNVSELLDRPSLNPSEYPSFKASDNPSPDPSGKGSGNPSGKVEPNPSDDPSVRPSPTTAPSPAPATATPSGTTDDEDLGEERYVALGEPRATKPPPRCNRHPNGNHDGPCAGCAKVREYGDRLEAEARRVELELRPNCPYCGGSNWREDDQGNPTRKCDHRRTA